MTDREKLVDLLWQCVDLDTPFGEIADYLLSNGVRLELKQATSDENKRWIPVTERLPESQTDMLVVAFWHENWQTMIGWHSDIGKKWRVVTPHGEFEPGGVTHWMPLPEPPKEGNNET